jgi:hypothetical protein
MFRNLVVIRRELIKRGLFVLGVFVVVASVLGRPEWSLSAGLGMAFSFIIFNQLMASQSAILAQRKRQIYFIHYLFRLLIYAVPISLFFFFQSYLNFIVLLLFLFSFQLLYVILELSKNFLRYKKRVKNGSIR